MTEPEPHEATLHGRRYVITGGSAGLGYFTAEQLAARGADVVIAARSPERSRIAIQSIRRRTPEAVVGFVPLDLADLASVREAARRLAERPVDGLVLNAGVLPWERVQPTADGFEPVFGVNQLGHFALTAQLLPALAPGAGIVALGSLSAVGQRLRLGDLQHRQRRAGRFTVYGRSKLAVMTTAVELDRRLRAAGSDLRSVIAHPGYASDAAGPARPGIVRLGGPVHAALLRRLANTKEQGARIVVHALLEGQGGELIGPDGWCFGLGGAPIRQRLRGPVLDPLAAAGLWAASEHLIGLEFLVPSGVE